MRNSTFLLFVFVLQPLFQQIAFAQDGNAALVPLPSIEDFTRGENGWALALGLGVEYESAFEGSDEFELEVDPAGALQWRRGNNIFYWAGEALGWRGRRADVWFLDAALSFDEGREESDSDEGRLDGLGDGEERTELVLQARRAFNTDWRNWLDVRLITGSGGTLGVIGVGQRFGRKLDGAGSELAVGVVFHDSEFANTDFGIDAGQSAASGLAETNLDGGFRSIVINYNVRHFISKKWQIFGEAFYERFSSEIDDSPIARNNFEAEVGLGFIYIFF